MKKSRGKFLKATTSWLSDEEISELVDREYMRKVINDALKLPKQQSAYGINFYSVPQKMRRFSSSKPTIHLC